MVALNKYLVLVVFIAGFIGTFALKNKTTRKVPVKAKYVPGNTLRRTPAGESWFNEILKFFNWLFFGGSNGDPSPFPGPLIKPEMMATFMGTYMRVPPNFKIDNNYISCHNDLSQVVFFYLYTRNNMDDPEKIKLGDAKSLDDSNYDAKNPTVIVTHGYLNNLNSSSVQKPKNALLKASNCNVIVVDWGKIAFTLYPEAVQEVQRVGAYIAKFIKFLLRFYRKHDLKDFHLIGHSLGAHGVAVAAKKLTGLNLARVTGLDPAGPGFNNASPGKRIDASDATNVDCIHTNGNRLGMMKATCQSDFYVNGGTHQPGCLVFDCLFGICSHMRVIDLFSESVTEQFKAYKCNKIPDATGKGCKVSNALMGYPANISMKGKFYVKTNSQSPYAIN